MIDKLETRAYLRAMARRISAAVIFAFIWWLILVLPAGPLSAGEVREGNPGRGGQTLDLKTLPVRGKATLVEVYSPYCPPCLRLAPLLEQLAQKRPDLVIKKVNIQRPEILGKIDWKSPLAKQLGVRAIPHFMIFNRKGKLAAQGSEARQQVQTWLKEAGLEKQ